MSPESHGGMVTDTTMVVDAFDLATRPRRTDDADGTSGRFEQSLGEDWSAAGVNGGLVAANCIRACQDLIEEPPIGILASTSFLRRGEFGDIEVGLDTVAESSRTTLVEAQVQQNGAVMAASRIRLVHGPTEGVEVAMDTAPPVARPVQLRSLQELLDGEDAAPLPIMRKYERRPTAWSATYPPPVPPEPALTEWLRFLSEPDIPVDRDIYRTTAEAVILSDMQGWFAVMEPSSWSEPFAPRTSELFVCATGALGSEWLLVRARCARASGGLAPSDVALWNESGEQVASATVSNLCVSSA